VQCTPVLRLASLYVLFSTLWVIFSDTLAIKLTGDDAAALHEVQKFKGIFFVIFSGLLFFLLAYRFYGRFTQSSRQKESLEKRFEVLNKTTLEGIFDFDLESGVIEVNKKMELFLPCDKGSYWQTFLERVHPDDKSRLEKELEGFLTSGQASGQSEYRLRGNDDIYYNLLISIYLLRNNETAKPARIIGTVLDISALRSLQTEQYKQQLKHKQELTSSIIQAQESEKNRWAEELHDNVCQLLSVARLYAGEIEAKPERAQQLAPEVKNIIMDAINDIRELSASIKPPSFSETTLKKAIEKLTLDISRVKQIGFTIEFDNFGESSLNNEQKILVYRIVQEQLNNIVKYAKAQHVSISVRRKEDDFLVSITDDGEGFNPSAVTTGIGLNNIRTRLQPYLGEMVIESSPGRGCKLSATFSTMSTAV